MVPLNVSAPREIPARAIWVDVVEPTREEAIGLAAQLGLHIELDDADLSFEMYGHVEVDGDQLMIVMQVDGSDDLTSSKGVVLMNTDRLVTFGADRYLRLRLRLPQPLTWRGARMLSRGS